MGASTPRSAQRGSRESNGTTHGVENLVRDFDRARNREELVRGLGEVAGGLRGHVCGQWASAVSGGWSGRTLLPP